MKCTIHRWRASALAASAAALLAAGTAAAAGSGPPPEALPPQQPDLVGGDLVPSATQKQFGLVSVGGGCSGTMLNRFWVLTADHCVTSNGAIGGPPAPLASLEVRATWSTQRARPTKVVRYARSHDKDMALLFLGAGDLGPVAEQRLYQSPPTAIGGTPSIVYRAYGRGIHTLAKKDANGNWQQTQSDGLYRTADYFAYFASTDLFRVKPNSRDQIGSPGDSGGAYFAIRNGAPASVIGVHSGSVKTYAPGKPQDSRWITSITRATANAVYEIRGDIQRTIREGMDNCPGVSAGCAVIESTALTILLN